MTTREELRLYTEQVTTQVETEFEAVRSLPPTLGDVEYLAAVVGIHGRLIADLLRYLRKVSVALEDVLPE